MDSDSRYRVAMALALIARVRELRLDLQRTFEINPMDSRPLEAHRESHEAYVRETTRYDGLDAGETRWFASVARHAGEWTPTPLPPMPFHHATRLEWTNAGDLPELGETQERLRFTFVVLSRQAEQREPRLYFITFRARIESICSEGAEASR